MNSLICVKAILANLEQSMRIGCIERQEFRRRIDSEVKRAPVVFDQVLYVLKSGVTTHLASSYASVDIFSALLDAGASTERRCTHGIHSLHCAAVLKRHEILRVWLERFPNYDVDIPDETNITPLHACLLRGGREGLMETVKILLEAGACVSTPCDLGLRPLHTASLNWDACPHRKSQVSWHTNSLSLSLFPY